MEAAKEVTRKRVSGLAKKMAHRTSEPTLTNTVEAARGRRGCRRRWRGACQFGKEAMFFFYPKPKHMHETCMNAPLSIPNLDFTNSPPATTHTAIRVSQRLRRRKRRDRALLRRANTGAAVRLDSCMPKTSYLGFAYLVVPGHQGGL